MEKTLIDYLNRSGLKDTLGIPKAVPLELEPLAQGEYNMNYLFTHPLSNQKLVLRINTASQMHLDNQIEYEFNALKLLQASGRTPKPFYLDGSKSLLPYGVLVMEYLHGRPLDYVRDLEKAAAIFADIHSCNIKGAGFLIKPEDPSGAILDECRAMVSVYLDSSLAESKKKDRLKRFVEAVGSRLQNRRAVDYSHSIINTEVNSGNFLINEDIGKCYLVDWEKPIISEAAQDLAHFIAPTTTFWKTDFILDEASKQEFIKAYCCFTEGGSDTEYINQRVNAYLPVTCLRGITWCAMAWVEYNRPGRPIMNEFTYKKICSYLHDDFMDMLEERYFNE